VIDWIVKESVACFCGAWQLVPMDGKFHYCQVCKRELYEQYMAKKKQDAKEQLKAKNPDMVTEAKAELADAAKKVQEAAAKVMFPSATLPTEKPLKVPMDLSMPEWEPNMPFQAEDRISRDWQRQRAATDSMDEEFRRQYMSNFDNLDVRILQVGPDGRETDVTGRINPQDLDESQIEKFEFQTPGSMIPRLPNGDVDRKRAMQMLGDLIMNGGLRFPGQIKRGLEYVSPAQQKLMKEMEAALAESEKILQHWKE
jgi:hypothetical protein